MNRFKKCHVLFVILWFLLFLFATNLILLATGYRLNKESVGISALSPNIRYNLERFSSPTGILRIVNFEGWALSTTYQANSQKNVSLILKTDKHSYELSTVGYERPDVSEVFKEFHLSPNDLGFAGSFSTIAIQNGTYELLIKLWEPNEDPELRSTGRFFQKDGQRFIEVQKDVGQLLSGLEQLKKTDLIENYVEECTYMENHLIVKGWAFLKGNNAAEDTIQLLIKSGNSEIVYYAAQKIDRSDVSHHFGDEKYLFSGFNINTSLDPNFEWPFSISVIINNTYLSEVEFSCSRNIGSQGDQ